LTAPKPKLSKNQSQLLFLAVFKTILQWLVLQSMWVKSIQAQNGVFSKFATNQFATVHSPNYAMLLDSDTLLEAEPNSAGQYGVEINFDLDNPVTGLKENVTKFTGNANDPKFLIRSTQFLMHIITI
jgi:hypothetical protein